jgi:hypothetical protein
MSDGKEVVSLNIYERLSAISEEVEAIPKRGKNKFSNYDYVMAVDVIGYIKKLLVKYGVYLSITEIEMERTPKTVDNKNWHSKIKCQGEFINIDNPKDKHTVTYYSVSADTLDKDIFKAKTNGLKYLLSQQFLIVTDDFVDTENDSDIKPVQYITKKQSADLNAMITEVNGNQSVFFNHFNINSLADLPAKEWENAVAMIERKRSAM